jgi:hypothetical protein
MKKILSLLMIVATVSVFAQSGLAPDFKNQPMLLQDGRLVKLEKQTSEMKTKAKAMGWGGASNFIFLSGENSPVTVPSNPVFYIKVDDDVDPETVFYLTKVTKFNKNGREIEMMRVSAFAGYGGKGKSTKEGQIACNYEKVEGTVFKFFPLEPLESGEYAFVSVSQGTTGSSQSMVYAFGVK